MRKKNRQENWHVDSKNGEQFEKIVLMWKAKVKWGERAKKSARRFELNAVELHAFEKCIIHLIPNSIIIDRDIGAPAALDDDWRASAYDAHKIM